MAKVLQFPRSPGPVPANILRKVPRRQANRAVRSREYLTPAEVDRLMAAAGAVGRSAGIGFATGRRSSGPTAMACGSRSSWT